MALTRRQKQVYDFLTSFVRENGYSPSFEEIGAALELRSLATVHKHISNLEAKGLLRRDYNRSRSIDVLPLRTRKPAAVQEFTLPLAGRVAAGQPIEQFEQPETISLTDFTRAKDVYVLEVTGESMKEEHIVNGDYVLVERTQTAHNGEIVVALVNNAETTLKRFYVEGSRVRLQPANSSMAPIILPAQSVKVQGKVVGVLRKY
jgi:repressor LexA